tara:strand:- start:4940 stop:5425 length:486 start_codon:yes stop_codon:yes gene_type:complete
MSVLTQGTHIFFKDPAAEAGSEMVRVRKATAFNPGASPADQIEETDLEETNSKQYRRGLRSPGQATMTVNATPSEPSHIRLSELAEGDDDLVLEWYVGWADGTAVPTVTAGEVTLPTTRTWYKFEAYVSDFPFDFQGNTLVATQVTMQRSGQGVWTPKEVV